MEGIDGKTTTLGLDKHGLTETAYMESDTLKTCKEILERVKKIEEWIDRQERFRRIKRQLEEPPGFQQS